MSDITIVPRHDPYDPLRAAVDASGTVVGDLACRKCGYNLRTLTINGRCPECGTSVGFSAQGDLLRFCDPDWVSLLGRGVKLVLFGIGVFVLAIIVNIIMGVI